MRKRGARSRWPRPGHQVPSGRQGIHHAIDHDRRALDVAPAVARVIGPRDRRMGDVRAVDLGERGVPPGPTSPCERVQVVKSSGCPGAAGVSSAGRAAGMVETAAGRPGPPRFPGLCRLCRQRRPGAERHAGHPAQGSSNARTFPGAGVHALGPDHRPRGNKNLPDRSVSTLRPATPRAAAGAGNPASPAPGGGTAAGAG